MVLFYFYFFDDESRTYTLLVVTKYLPIKFERVINSSDRNDIETYAYVIKSYYRKFSAWPDLKWSYKRYAAWTFSFAIV